MVDYKFKILITILVKKGILSEHDAKSMTSVDDLLSLFIETDMIGKRDVHETSRKFIYLALRINFIRTTCPPGSLVQNVRDVLNKEGWMSESDKQFIIDQMNIKNKE